MRRIATSPCQRPLCTFPQRPWTVTKSNVSSMLEPNIDIYFCTRIECVCVKCLFTFPISSPSCSCSYGMSHSCRYTLVWLALREMGSLHRPTAPRRHMEEGRSSSPSSSHSSVLFFLLNWSAASSSSVAYAPSTSS